MIQIDRRKFIGALVCTLAIPSVGRATGSEVYNSSIKTDIDFAALTSSEWRSLAGTNGGHLLNSKLARKGYQIIPYFAKAEDWEDLNWRETFINESAKQGKQFLCAVYRPNRDNKYMVWRATISETF